MNVLHICSDFSSSKVHLNLYLRLDEFGIHQTIYTCFRDSNRFNKNRFESPNSTIIYSNILHLYHRVFYHLKLSTIYRDIIQRVNPNDFDCIHATTLFSDGGVAYYIWKHYQIPYIVAVRNVDVNIFMKYAPYSWKTGRNILLNASKIVFISKALRDSFCRHIMIKDILPNIIDKIIVQPNGIDEYWIEHIRSDKISDDSILYVGLFNSNKNVLRLMRSVIQLKNAHPTIKLNLVGGYGNQLKRVLKLVEKYPDLFYYHGIVSDKEKLRQLYLSNRIFAMPSKHETFGLVYIEALSQNLSLLYTKGQGIDKLFDFDIGIAVNPYSIFDIKNALESLLKNDNINNNQVDFSMFSWHNIAKIYILIYRDICKSCLIEKYL